MVNSATFDTNTSIGPGDRNASKVSTNQSQIDISTRSTVSRTSPRQKNATPDSEVALSQVAVTSKTEPEEKHLIESAVVGEITEEDNTLCCSVPLDKVQGVFPTIHPKCDEPKPTRKLLCLYCERSFASSNLRQKHVERIHSVKKNRRLSSRKQQLTSTPCIYCEKLNGSENTLKELFEHLANEHSNKYFGCLPCEERFLTATSLYDHNATLHPTVEILKTPVNILNTEDDTEEKEVKLTRSRVKPKLDIDENPKKIIVKSQKAKLKELRSKKLTVKSSRIALNRRESKRLQALAKLTQTEKKKRQKPVDRKLNNATKTEAVQERAKQTSICVNPYPEFDNYYRVKKITDHSIDNLKISSLTFDDVFDKAFFNRIKCNIEENLLHHIDGKLFKNEESESRISNFEKVPTVPQEIQNSASENYGCELSLNAVTPVAALSLNSQFGEDFEYQIEYGSKPSKKKTQTKKDEVHYKYFTRRKFQASILEHKENRDLSKLDMWTQLAIKHRQQKIIDDKKSAKEMLEYSLCDEYKNKVRREELNRILDRRGPFEDLREEASKKVALDKLNSVSEDSISHESFTEVREVLNEILNRVFSVTEEPIEVIEETTNTQIPSSSLSSSSSKSDLGEIPDFLNLRRTSSLPTDGEIDQSDKITLICSSQDTENFELPTNATRGKNELIELSGEWARCRMYICAACGAKLPNMKYLLDHKTIYHQNVWVQHYEFVGNQSDLYRNLSIPTLGKVGYVEDTILCKAWKRSEARVCSKCKKQCNSLGELHRHVLECGGDWTWILVRKKCKYRYGAKSRRRRRGMGMVLKVHTKRKTDLTEKKTYKYDGPRQRPSDAETIQRMLANLPAKRSTRKLIAIYDGVRRRQKTKELEKAKQKKVKCGKVIYNKRSNIKETTEKTINAAVPLKNSQRSNKSSNARSLRSLSRVLSSRILDTNKTLSVKRKLKVLHERRRTRQSMIAEEKKPRDVDDDNISETPKETKKNKVEAEEDTEPKRTSPRSTKVMRKMKLLSGNINIKSFFPVKKRKDKKGLAEESTQETKDIPTRNKKKSNEVEEDGKKEVSEEKVVPKVTKRDRLSNLVRSLSMNKKKNSKKTSQEKPSEDTAQGIPKKSASKEELELTNKKRKLKQSFRNVINRVKRLKIDAAPETVQIPLVEKLQSPPKSPFLDENQQEKGPPVKIVNPSNTEAKENIADISKTVHTVIAFNEGNEDSPVPENIFKLDSDNEKNLQAKGEPNFDIRPATPDKSPSESEAKESLDTSQVQDKEKLELLSIETCVKSKVVPMISPNMKGKIRKPARGLNDCIAMLTSKLQQKTTETSVKPTTLNILPPTTNPPKIVTDPSPQKAECILKIPTFKTHNESTDEVALDLSTKSRKKESEHLVPLKLTKTFPPSPDSVFGKSSPWDFNSLTSVERIIENVVSNKLQEPQKFKSNSLPRNSIDQTIQNVIDGHLKQQKFVQTKSTVDDIIDYVINFDSVSENNNLNSATAAELPNVIFPLKEKRRKGSLRKLKSLEKLITSDKSTLEPLLLKKIEVPIVQNTDSLKVTPEKDQISQVQSGNRNSAKEVLQVARKGDKARNAKKNNENYPKSLLLETNLDAVITAKEIENKVPSSREDLDESKSANITIDNEDEPHVMENKTVAHDISTSSLAKPIELNLSDDVKINEEILDFGSKTKNKTKQNLRTFRKQNKTKQVVPKEKNYSEVSNQEKEDKVDNNKLGLAEEQRTPTDVKIDKILGDEVESEIIKIKVKTKVKPKKVTKKTINEVEKIGQELLNVDNTRLPSKDVVNEVENDGEVVARDVELINPTAADQLVTDPVPLNKNLKLSFKTKRKKKGKKKLRFTMKKKKIIPVPKDYLVIDNANNTLVESGIIEDSKTETEMGFNNIDQEIQREKHTEISTVTTSDNVDNKDDVNKNIGLQESNILNNVKPKTKKPKLKKLHKSVQQTLTKPTSSILKPAILSITSILNIDSSEKALQNAEETSPNSQSISSGPDESTIAEHSEIERNVVTSPGLKAKKRGRKAKKRLNMPKRKTFKFLPLSSICQPNASISENRPVEKLAINNGPMVLQIEEKSIELKTTESNDETISVASIQHEAESSENEKVISLKINEEDEKILEAEPSETGIAAPLENSVSQLNDHQQFKITESTETFNINKEVKIKKKPGRKPKKRRSLKVAEITKNRNCLEVEKSENVQDKLEENVENIVESENDTVPTQSVDAESPLVRKLSKRKSNITEQEPVEDLNLLVESTNNENSSDNNVTENLVSVNETEEIPEGKRILPDRKSKRIKKITETSDGENETIDGSSNKPVEIPTLQEDNLESLEPSLQTPRKMPSRKSKSEKKQENAINENIDVIENLDETQIEDISSLEQAEKLENDSLIENTDSVELIKTPKRATRSLENLNIISDEISNKSRITKTESLKNLSTAVEEVIETLSDAKPEVVSSETLTETSQAVTSLLNPTIINLPNETKGKVKRSTRLKKPIVTEDKDTLPSENLPYAESAERTISLENLNEISTKDPLDEVEIKSRPKRSVRSLRNIKTNDSVAKEFKDVPESSSGSAENVVATSENSRSSKLELMNSNEIKTKPKKTKRFLEPALEVSMLEVVSKTASEEMTDISNLNTLEKDTSLLKQAELIDTTPEFKSRPKRLKTPTVLATIIDDSSSEKVSKPKRSTRSITPRKLTPKTFSRTSELSKDSSVCEESISSIEDSSNLKDVTEHVEIEAVGKLKASNPMKESTILDEESDTISRSVQDFSSKIKLNKMVEKSVDTLIMRPTNVTEKKSKTKRKVKNSKKLSESLSFENLTTNTDTISSENLSVSENTSVSENMDHFLTSSEYSIDMESKIKAAIKKSISKQSSIDIDTSETTATTIEVQNDGLNQSELLSSPTINKSLENLNVIDNNISKQKLVPTKENEDLNTASKGKGLGYEEDSIFEDEIRHAPKRAEINVEQAETINNVLDSKAKQFSELSSVNTFGIRRTRSSNNMTSSTESLSKLNDSLDAEVSTIMGYSEFASPDRKISRSSKNRSVSLKTIFNSSPLSNSSESEGSPQKPRRSNRACKNLRETSLMSSSEESLSTFINNSDNSQLLKGDFVSHTAIKPLRKSKSLKSDSSKEENTNSVVVTDGDSNQKVVIDTTTTIESVDLKDNNILEDSFQKSEESSSSEGSVKELEEKIRNAIRQALQSVSNDNEEDRNEPSTIDDKSGSTLDLDLPSQKPLANASEDSKVTAEASRDVTDNSDLNEELNRPQSSKSIKRKTKNKLSNNLTDSTDDLNTNSVTSEVDDGLFTSRSLRRKSVVNYAEVEEPKEITEDFETTKNNTETESSKNHDDTSVAEVNNPNLVNESNETSNEFENDDKQVDDDTESKSKENNCVLKENLSKNTLPETNNGIRKNRLKLRGKKGKRRFLRNHKLDVIIPEVDVAKQLTEIPIVSVNLVTAARAESTTEEQVGTVKEPPIKIIINKHKARRKSKNIKKAGPKGHNDLYKDFALVIKKKHRAPIITFSPPDAFSKEDSCSMQMPPLIPEVSKHSDDSVQEMDMELDEMPIKTNIIETPKKDISLLETEDSKEDKTIIDEEDSIVNTGRKSGRKKKVKSRNSRKYSHKNVTATATEITVSVEDIAINKDIDKIATKNEYTDRGNYSPYVINGNTSNKFVLDKDDFSSDDFEVDNSFEDSIIFDDSAPKKPSVDADTLFNKLIESTEFVKPLVLKKTKILRKKSAKKTKNLPHSNESLDEVAEYATLDSLLENDFNSTTNEDTSKDEISDTLSLTSGDSSYLSKVIDDVDDQETEINFGFLIPAKKVTKKSKKKGARKKSKCKDFNVEGIQSENLDEEINKNIDIIQALSKEISDLEKSTLSGLPIYTKVDELKKEDIDKLYAFSETEDFELEKPLELPRRLPRKNDILKKNSQRTEEATKEVLLCKETSKKPKIVVEKVEVKPVLNFSGVFSEKENFEISKLTKRKSKEISIPLPEEKLNTPITDSGSRKSMRSAKAKALESIHDEALAELTDTETITDKRFINDTIDSDSKKINKKVKKTEKTFDKLTNALESIPDEALAALTDTETITDKKFINDTIDSDSKKINKKVKKTEKPFNKLTKALKSIPDKALAELTDIEIITDKRSIKDIFDSNSKKINKNVKKTEKTLDKLTLESIDDGALEKLTDTETIADKRFINDTIDSDSKKINKKVKKTEKTFVKLTLESIRDGALEELTDTETITGKSFIKDIIDSDSKKINKKVKKTEIDKLALESIHDRALAELTDTETIADKKFIKDIIDSDTKINKKVKRSEKSFDKLQLPPLESEATKDIDEKCEAPTACADDSKVETVEQVVETNINSVNKPTKRGKKIDKTFNKFDLIQDTNQLIEPECSKDVDRQQENVEDLVEKKPKRDATNSESKKLNRKAKKSEKVLNSLDFSQECFTTKDIDKEQEHAIAVKDLKKISRKQIRDEPFLQLGESYDFPKVGLAGREAPLLEDLVAELNGMEELENSIERELNAEMELQKEKESKSIESESVTEINNLEENNLVTEENQELRRSRRGSRKVASYNENDLIDPLIDALESKRMGKKKDDKFSLEAKRKREAEKKLNSEELFDLLKASTTDDLYVPKQQNSFLNNLEDSSRDITDENFDNMFENMLEKTAFLTQKRDDIDKIYEFDENVDSLTNDDIKTKVIKKSKQLPAVEPVCISQDSTSNSKSKSDKFESNYCEICNKSFVKLENLIKHRRTLTHIQKLSEIEAKEAEKSKIISAHEDENSRESAIEPPSLPENPQFEKDDLKIGDILAIKDDIRPPFNPNHSLKLADIINDVLNKPVLPCLDEEPNKFSDIILQNDTKRYKSLGERKSFDSDSILTSESHLTEPYESKTTKTILEKQISLLENIIENQTTNYLDDTSLTTSEKSDTPSEPSSPVIAKPSTNVNSFLKPTQYEEISEDSANLRTCDDQKPRKTLNRDEELFLECCSLLKSSSEVSSSYSNKKVPGKAVGTLGLKPVEEPGLTENYNLLQKTDSNNAVDDYSDNSRIPTPLGNSYDDYASNSNTISSNWGMDKPGNESREIDGTVARLSFENITEKTHEDVINTGKLANKRTEVLADRATSQKSSTDELSDVSLIDKKIMTKGARKVFEGLKVSIPTEELNLEEVLNNSPKQKKIDLVFIERKAEEEKQLCSPPSKRKSKPVKNAQVGSNLLFKVSKKKLPSPTVSKEKNETEYDVYDFEETQDNTDAFSKPNYRTFRTNKTGENESEGERYDFAEPEGVISTTTKKPKTHENITKKKCMIMGRIFKNAAAKSKMEDLNDDIRKIPEIDNEELVENYVAECNKVIITGSVQLKHESKPNSPKLECDTSDQHIEEKVEIDRDQKQPTKPGKPEVKKPDTKKKTKLKGKKRVRTNSDSTDDEFSLGKAKRKTSRKNAKEEDNIINLEQELKECIGVASRKSQRKCTSGKQNVLVEYWSSDDSQFEALLEKQIIEIKPKPRPQSIEIPTEPETAQVLPLPEPPVVPKKPMQKKKSTEKKKIKSHEQTLDGSSSNRRKRAAVNPLYHWSSSSEDETNDLIEIKPLRDELEDDEDRPVQHGWIVGDSPKKLVTMLAQAKGKKADIDCVKEQSKKRTNTAS